MSRYAMMAGVQKERRRISETFERENLHPLLKWLNPPDSWRIDTLHRRLIVEPAAETDFWQRTHYGFRADNGHLLYGEVIGDGALAATVLARPAHQYDQAGLMIRASEDCWLKTSVEYEHDEPSKLGVVVTNNGFSDWSIQHFPGADLVYCLRIRWQGDDFFVEYALTETGPWHLMRVAHLFRSPDICWLCGVYACSPKGFGFRAEFSSLSIQGDDIPPEHR